MDIVQVYQATKLHIKLPKQPTYMHWFVALSAWNASLFLVADQIVLIASAYWILWIEYIRNG